MQELQIGGTGGGAAGFASDLREKPRDGGQVADKAWFF
jgi:hypothetical protein